MEVGKKFENIISYNDNMKKGMADKLFFLGRIKSKGTNTIFVDFGCADGALINTLCSIPSSKPRYDEYYKDIYIGYDISETMINFAKTNFDSVQTKDIVQFTNDWSDVEKIVKSDEHKYDTKVLILSSVIHEVYSYATSKNDINEFWSRVLNTGFDYICVRDMMITSNYTKNNNCISLANNIKTKESNDYIEEFEKKWGNLDKNIVNIFHYLLKYRWKVNWNRELNENYFPIWIEDFLDKMKEKYNITYFERFCVPFLRNCIKEDFGIDIEKYGYTHIKAIFEKK